jgi:hypothetical protein
MRTLCGGRIASVIITRAREMPPKQHVMQDDSHTPNVHCRRVQIDALVIQLASHFRGNVQLGSAISC